MHRWVIPVVVIGLVCSGTVIALSGSGTEGDPWLIQSLDDFNDFASDPNYWDDYTRLETDVNLAGMAYERAVIAPDVNDEDGFQGTAFTGVFDGNDHKIIGLLIDDGGAGNNYLGLFGYIDGSEIRNLGIECVSVYGRIYYSSYVGGLVGENYGISSSISNCYSTGSVSSKGNYIGGLVGSNGDRYNREGGAITNCYSTCDVNGTIDFIGGLVGADFSGSISNCYFTGSVIGSGEDIGGLVGGAYRGSIVNSYSACDVSGNGDSVGGLVGDNDLCIVSNCYAIGDVNGWWAVGGLIGESSGEVSNCYSAGNVNGAYEVGGLVGTNRRNISNCYSTADVNGVEQVGGLVGKFDWQMRDCYFSGSVRGTNGVGGLAGHTVAGTIWNCFWDIDTSGEPNACGDIHIFCCDPNYGKTTTEMKQQSTFTDWDFINVWNIGENQTYPYLRTVLTSDINKDRITNFLDLCIVADQWLNKQ